jgi:hypothetical protein
MRREQSLRGHPLWDTKMTMYETKIAKVLLVGKRSRKTPMVGGAGWKELLHEPILHGSSMAQRQVHRHTDIRTIIMARSMRTQCICPGAHGAGPWRVSVRGWG